MAQVVGSRSAEALVKVGLRRQTVVRALVTELGLSDREAEVAWRAATRRYDEIPEIHRAIRGLVAHDA